MSKSPFKKRHYLRISSVLAVEFCLLDEAGRHLTPYLQGFTNNIGKGGICLVVNDLWWGFADRLKSFDTIALQVNLPFKEKGIFTQGKIVWQEEHKQAKFTQYRLGIEFESAPPAAAHLLFGYALGKKLVTFLVVGGLFVFLLVSLGLYYQRQKLVRENKAFLALYHQGLTQNAAFKGNLIQQQYEIRQLGFKKKRIARKLALARKELTQWQEKYAVEQTGGVKDKTAASGLKHNIMTLEGRIVSLQKDNARLKALFTLQARSQNVLKTEFKMRQGRSWAAGKKIIAGMFDWIKNRQDLRTGLVLSYDGDRDLRNVAFTYDQSLATIVFLMFDDYAGARKILDFYLKQAKLGKPIYNAYYTSGGVYEYTVHSGVNAWVGLASLNYLRKTQDKRYLPLARKVADFLFTMMDKEGGIPGGPNIRWYSTEHNLDSYAFFKLFYELTGKHKYLDASEKIKQWLSRYAYTSNVVPVRRGKGDATIATDTYAWSITALGPKVLLSLMMSPDEILDFAVKNCAVNTTFMRNGESIKVRGFDFAKYRNLPRGGVISCEWTAQMILSFEIMANYYYHKNHLKSRSYLNEAAMYFRQLQQLIISSPSPVGKANPTLPYASQSNVDTGHGWRTPRGRDTGSLSATAYFLMAYRGFNPLQSTSLKESLQNTEGSAADNSYAKAN